MSHLFPEPVYLSALHKKKEPPKPKDGLPGKDGRDGLDGKDGKDGLNGKDGRDGLNGVDGKDGAKGTKGDRGPAGKDGKDGKDGVDFTPPDGMEDFDIESGHLVKRYRNGNVVALKLPRQVRGGGTSRQTVRGIATVVAGEKSVRITATDTSITTADDILIVTAAATITMPTAVGSTKTYKIKRSGSGDVTVVGISGQTVEGESSRIINVNLYALELHSDGSNWVEL